MGLSVYSSELIEIKVVHMSLSLVEELVSNGSTSTQALFRKVHRAILSLDPRVVVRPNKAYVGYMYSFNFAQLVILKGSLKVYLPPGRTWEDPKSWVKLHGSHIRTRKYQHFKITREEDVEYSLFLIAQAMKASREEQRT